MNYHMPIDVYDGYKSTLPSGWISPDGTYYSSDYYLEGHAECLKNALGTTNEDAGLLMGWVKIYWEWGSERSHYSLNPLGPIQYYTKKPLTQAQVNTLFELGFTDLYPEDKEYTN